MITIQLNDTKEIRSVTANEAFDLIDRGLAVRFEGKKESKHFTKDIGYKHRQMRPMTKTT